MHDYSEIGPLAVVLLVVVGTAYAANVDQNDVVNIELTKISMSQAVAVAEQAGHGKALRAEYENTLSGWAYDVEVVSGAKVFDIRVDADKGIVIFSAEDSVDHDDGTDKQD